MEDKLRMRYRIDGRLREVPVPDISRLQQSVIARLKVMAKLDIAERRLPQDGRINLQIAGRTHRRPCGDDSIRGRRKRNSLRLLGQEKFNLDRLQVETDLRAEVEALLKKPNGIVLVTGPTGSGKSTTLYTFLFPAR